MLQPRLGDVVLGPGRVEECVVNVWPVDSTPVSSHVMQVNNVVKCLGFLCFMEIVLCYFTITKKAIHMSKH